MKYWMLFNATTGIIAAISSETTPSNTIVWVAGWVVMAVISAIVYAGSTDRE